MRNEENMNSDEDHSVFSREREAGKREEIKTQGQDETAPGTKRERGKRTQEIEIQGPKERARHGLGKPGHERYK